MQNLASSVERDIHILKRIAKVTARRRNVLLEDGDSRINGRLHVAQECPEILGPILKGGALRSQTKWIRGLSWVERGKRLP